MTLDILAFAAHPDDVELSGSGTLALHAANNRKVGIVDLTRGEMGTRGTPEIRDEEAKHSAEILGLSVRKNIGFKDVFFENDLPHQLEIIKMIRAYRPAIVLANAISDRHPDHGKAAQLIKQSFFMSGLAKIQTEYKGQLQETYRPKALYHYIQNNYIEPDFIVDISSVWQKKIDSIKAFKSQFYNPESDEPDTFISSKEFFEFVEARSITMGHRIGVKYGEGFTVNRTLGTRDLFNLL